MPPRSLLDFLRASGVGPPAFDSLAEFEASPGEKIGIVTAALVAGFAWIEQGIDFVTETELFATAPSARDATASRSRSAMSKR